jgi:gas vesicle protein
MSRTLIVAVVIAAIGAGGYLYLNQPEPTPAEQLQAAEQDVNDAVDETVSAAQDTATDAADTASDAATSLTDQAADAVDSAAEQVGDAASSLTEQANEAASSVAEQAGDQVAAAAGQGQDLFNSWIQGGMLTVQNFDYETMVASVENSTLTEEVKTGAIRILDDIKASPELVVEKMQDLRNLLTQQ